MNLDGFSIIAVTGQMAAGKNYICSQLEAEGWHSIDCDILVHKAIVEATPKILATFKPYAEKMGLELENGDGSVNRRVLGQIVFSDQRLLTMQENIVYPIITKMVEDFINAYQGQKIILNATVLYKTPDLLEKCDAVLFVKAPLLKRLIRAKKRDKMPLKQILRRFNTQKDLLKQYKSTKKTVILVKN